MNFKSETNLILILNSEKFIIPSNFQYLPDINISIFKILLEKRKYEVRSNVSKKVFESFIDNWINMKIPNVTSDNISEFELLSEEFDPM